MNYRGIEIKEADGNLCFSVGVHDYSVGQKVDGIEGAQRIIGDVLDRSFEVQGVKVTPSDASEAEALVFTLHGKTYRVQADDENGNREDMAMKMVELAISGLRAA